MAAAVNAMNATSECTLMDGHRMVASNVDKIAPRLLRQLCVLCVPGRAHGWRSGVYGLPLVKAQARLSRFQQQEQQDDGEWWPFDIRSLLVAVTRVEENTYICSDTQVEAGPTNNWSDPVEMTNRMNKALGRRM